MERSCSTDRCSKRVKYTCSCTDPEVLFCDKHFLQHSKTQGRHNIEYLMIELDNTQKIKLFSKLNQIIKHIKEIKKIVVLNAKTLIKNIQIETSRTLRKFKEFQSLSYEALNLNSIPKDNYEKFKNFKLETFQSTIHRVSEINQKIKTLFELFSNQLESWKVCNQFIFQELSTGKVVSIDLNSFVSSVLFTLGNIRIYNTSKINLNDYFVFGDRGSIRAESIGKACIIDPNYQQYYRIKNSPGKHIGGSVYKNDKVFIFGSSKMDKLNTCHCYDLKLRHWTSLSQLPWDSVEITAGLIGNDIILSGFTTNWCYSFNDSVCLKIFKLEGSISKIVFDGWILCVSILYENQNQNLSKWRAYELSYKLNQCTITIGSCRKSYFLYFMNRCEKLTRINTRTKNIEEINYM